MAILKKRTSSKQLPEARGLDRAPLGSIIRGVDDTPSLTGRGPSSITSAGGAGGSNAVQSKGSAGTSGRPFTSAFTNPATTKNTLTTKTSSTPKTTLAPKTSLTTSTSNTPKTSLAPKTTLTSSTTPTTRPTITNTTTNTPTTKTTTGTNTVRPTVKPNISNPNSLSSKMTNALTGAVLGAGTKLLVDKITGKPTTAPTGGTKPPAGGTTGGARPPAGGTTSGARPPAGGAKPPAGGATNSTVTSKVLTDEEVQAELDRVKASEEPWTPPEGAVKNSDGTYSVTEDGIVSIFNSDGTLAGMEAAPGASSSSSGERVSDLASLGPGESIVYDNGTTVTAIDDGNGGVKYVYGGTDAATGFGPKGGGTRGLGGDTAEAGGASDTTVAGEEVQYFDDGFGNIYTLNSDGSYTLYSEGNYAENTYVDPESGKTWTMADDGTWSLEGGDTYADNTYYDAESGATWRLSDSGMWTLEGDEPEYYGDSLYADNIESEDNADYLYAGNDTNEDYYDYGDYPYDEYAKRGGLITMMKQGGVAHMADGGYLPEGAVDNGDGTYTIGRFTYDMMTDEYLYSMDDGVITNVNPDRVSSTTPQLDYFDSDSLGNIFKNGELYMNAADVPSGIRSAGGGERNWYDEYVKPVLTGGQRLASDALGNITGALGTTAGAAGAGALIATLLGQDFGGGTGNQNQGLDMSKVGVINPRTTDFGIGPTRFVGYEDYGTSDGDYTPNAELLKNLNAPGYNPVNEGDYGYEEVAAEEAEPTQKMASGGLSSMSTPVASYYTFGQPADILANLGMRPQPPMNPPDMMPQIGQQQPPQMAQQQGLPQQMPPQMAQQAPQGMPQQGIMPQQQGMPPPMRKGGLPRASDVPIVEGRMDFRKGSAVHGPGDGQSDDIPAMLADGEYVIDAETVAQIGNGSTKAGAQALDKFRESIRAHKRSAPVNKIPPKTKALTSYLKG